jgi:hypothetical protein
MPFYVPGKTFLAHVVTYLEKKAHKAQSVIKFLPERLFKSRS